MLTQEERDARLAVINDEVSRLDRFTTLTAAQTATRTKLLTERETLTRETAESFLAVRRAAVLVAARESGQIESGTEHDRDPIRDGRDVAAPFRGDPWDGAVRMAAPGPYNSWGPAELRSRALTAIERASGTTDKGRERATRILAEWDNVRGDLARQCLLTSSPEYVSAFGRLIRGDTLLTEAEVHAVRAVQDVQRALSLTDAAGGYLVPFQLDPTIMLDSAGAVSPVRRLARNVVATGDVWNGVSAAQVVASYDAEAAEVGDDTPVVGQPSVTIRMARVFLPYSIEVGQDGANFTAEMSRLMLDARDVLEADVHVNGTAAANQPVGVVTALTGGAREFPANAPGTLAVEDLSELYASVGPRWRDRGTWLMGTAEGVSVGGFTTEDTIALPPLATEVLGRPVEYASTMPAGDVVFGDFGSGMVVADRVGFTIEPVPHLFGAAHRPTGQRGLFGWCRNGSNVVTPSALSLLNV